MKRVDIHKPQFMVRDKALADRGETPICCNKQIAYDFDDLIRLMSCGLHFN